MQTETLALKPSIQTAARAAVMLTEEIMDQINASKMGTMGDDGTRVIMAATLAAAILTGNVTNDKAVNSCHIATITR